MPRRTATLLASTFILIALLCVALLVPAPYAEESPGPTVNTLATNAGEPVLQITGHKTYPTTGHLNMTTVRVTDADYHMNLVESVIGWLKHDDRVVEHDTLYPQGQTSQQANQENAEEFTQSQDSAKVVALKKLGIPVQTEVIVSAVVKGAPAEGKLHAGDVLKAVDGTAVKAPADVATLVTKHQPGQPVVFTVIPEAAAKQKQTRTTQVTVTTAASADSGKARAVVGIQAGVEHVFPFDIDIRLADVGGPSAGLMFSLGLIDKMTPENLTGGKFIAGTGTIDDSGTVGPIGGIGLKTIGARNQGAQYFFTPADNCAEASEDTPSGLRLVKVKSIDDALAALKDIRTGDTSALPSCSKS